MPFQKFQARCRRSPVAFAKECESFLSQSIVSSAIHLHPWLVKFLLSHLKTVVNESGEKAVGWKLAQRNYGAAGAFPSGVLNWVNGVGGIRKA